MFYSILTKVIFAVSAFSKLYVKLAQASDIT